MGPTNAGCLRTGIVVDKAEIIQTYGLHTARFALPVQENTKFNLLIFLCTENGRQVLRHFRLAKVVIYVIRNT